WGGGAGRQDGEGRPEAGLTSGPSCGQGSRRPARPERIGERSGQGPLRPRLPSGVKAPLVARLCLGCCFPGLFGPDCSRTLTISWFYFSLLSPAVTPRQQRDHALLGSRPRLPPSPPDRPCGSAGAALGRTLAPARAVQRGLRPRRGGHSPWVAQIEGSWAGTLGFSSPTFLSRPTGMCSSSSRGLAPRGNTTWGPKNYKSLHPPRQGRERRGAGRSGARWLEMGTDKGGGGRRCLLCAGHFAQYTCSLSNVHNPARRYCIQLKESLSTGQTSITQLPSGRDGIEPRVL
ncbi:uncharacterized protein WCI35_008106, partial [Daubentonia madagascariensis]